MYTLIKDLGNRRYYSLDEPSTFCSRDIKIKPYSIVCVSDATTHIERLAFAIYLEEGFTLEDLRNGTPKCTTRDLAHVCGFLTWSIHGGESDSVFPDEWYLDQISGKIIEITINV